MSLEAKNFTSSLSGKFAVDFKPFTYLAVKKLSIENTGAAVLDFDIPNFIRSCSGRPSKLFSWVVLRETPSLTM